MSISLATVGLIAGLGSTIYGGIRNASAAKKADKKQKETEAEQSARNNAWYTRNYYRDYLNTVEAQNAMKRYRDAWEERTREARARAAITGGTPEQAQAVAEAGGEAMGDLMGNLAAQGESNKQMIDRQKLEMDNALAAQGLDYDLKKYAQEQESARNIMSAGLNLTAGSLQSMAAANTLPSQAAPEGTRSIMGGESTQLAGSVANPVGKEVGINPTLADEMLAEERVYNDYYSKNKNYY